MQEVLRSGGGHRQGRNVHLARLRFALCLFEIIARRSRHHGHELNLQDTEGNRTGEQHTKPLQPCRDAPLHRIEISSGSLNRSESTPVSATARAIVLKACVMKSVRSVMAERPPWALVSLMAIHDLAGTSPQPVTPRGGQTQHRPNRVVRICKPGSGRRHADGKTRHGQ